MNCEFLGGPLDHHIFYLAPRPDTIGADDGGRYVYDGDGIYRYQPALAPVPAAEAATDDEASDVEHVRPAPQPAAQRRPRTRKTTRR